MTILALTLIGMRMVILLLIAVSLQSVFAPKDHPLESHGLLLISFAYFLGIMYYFVQEAFKRLKVTLHRPSIVILLDAICTPFMYLRIGPWRRVSDITTALPDAMKATKLTQLHFEGIHKNKKINADADSSYLERYQVARQLGLEKSGAKLSPAGHLVLQNNLANRVVIRLNFVEYLKKHPKVVRGLLLLLFCDLWIFSNRNKTDCFKPFTVR